MQDIDQYIGFSLTYLLNFFLYIIHPFSEHVIHNNILKNTNNIVSECVAIYIAIIMFDVLNWAVVVSHLRLVCTHTDHHRLLVYTRSLAFVVMSILYLYNVHALMLNEALNHILSHRL